MKKASTFLDEAGKQAIEAAVKAAEDRTAGEIVPVLATASGRYDRAEDIVGLLTGLLALTVCWMACPTLHATSGWGGGLLQSTAGLLPALVSVVVGFIVGSGLATWFPVLRLPFIRPSEMAAEVQRAARVAFMVQRVRKTDAATGVLIYVSLYERQVVVLPDHGITGLTSPDVWREVRDRLIAGLKRGDGAGGFRAAIEKCGDILAEHSPRQSDDVDELPNTLRIID